MALMTRLHSDKLEYTSSDSVQNVIRYITRTRSPETKADDLVLWGDSAGYFYNKSVVEIIHEFSFIHKLYAPYTGKSTCKICHYVFKIYDDDVNFQANIEALNITDSNYLSWINKFSGE